ncbi:MAG: pyridoxamine 5'-phosphate oxidase family protein [Pseudomonadota bacterium]
MTQKAGTDRTRIRRLGDRGKYEPEDLKAVLDACQTCHVAYVVDGEPRIIPTLYMRQGDYVYLHGNRQAALLKHLGSGGFAALSVMAVDGVVVARSGFHCSMNYRSAVLFGDGEAVPDAEREQILDAFVEALVPGHAAAIRPATPQELAATAVVRIPIREGSVKLRSGDAVDAEGDLLSDVWAGVIPLATAAALPQSNGDLKAGVAIPDYIEAYRPPV